MTLQQLPLFSPEAEPYHDGKRMTSRSDTEQGKTVSTDMTSRLPARPYANRAPRVAHSETSAAAADALTPRLAPLQRQVILAIAKHDSLSDEAIDRLCHAVKTLRPRRVELTRAGFLEDSGDRMKADSGLMVALWVLTDKGARAAALLLVEEKGI